MIKRLSPWKNIKLTSLNAISQPLFDPRTGNEWRLACFGIVSFSVDWFRPLYNQVRFLLPYQIEMQSRLMGKTSLMELLRYTGRI